MKAVRKVDPKGNAMQKIYHKKDDLSLAKKELSTQLEFLWYHSENQISEQKKEEIIESHTENSDFQDLINETENETGVTADRDEVLTVKSDHVQNDRDEQIIDEIIEQDETDLMSLPDCFPGKGEVKEYYFTLVSKTDRGFCYEVSLNGVITHYETFHRKINKRFGNISYPGSNSFGIWAWTFHKREDALEKLRTL